MPWRLADLETARASGAQPIPSPDTDTTAVTAPMVTNTNGSRTARPNTRAGTRAGPSARTTAATPTSTEPGQTGSTRAHSTSPRESSTLSPTARGRQAEAQAASSMARPVTG